MQMFALLLQGLSNEICRTLRLRALAGCVPFSRIMIVPTVTPIAQERYESEQNLTRKKLSKEDN
jgi:hypothetical protein